MTHTKEPWHYGDEDEGFDGVEHVQIHAGRYCDPSFREIARVEAAFDGDKHLPLCEETRSNARRIVSCVNALAGMNPDALADVVEALEAVVNFETGALDDAKLALARLRGEA